jgi:HNH endonuclease
VRKKTAKIFLSREEKRYVTEGSPWDAVIEAIQKTSSVPPLVDQDLLDDLHKKKWVLLRLCDRQEWKCFWCGRTMTKDACIGAPRYRTLEHVVPTSTKGKNIDKLENLRAACRECNESRSAWSNGLGMARKVTEQQSQISLLTYENLEMKTVLSGRCFLCKLRVWLKKILRKESS